MNRLRTTVPALLLAVLLAACATTRPATGLNNQAAWVEAIRQRIRSNLVMPPDTPTGITAVFSVDQAPTGEVVGAALKSSSGHPAYDLAAFRAILKSSPLPRPDNQRDFVGSLVLKFTP